MKQTDRKWKYWRGLGVWLICIAIIFVVPLGISKLNQPAVIGLTWQQPAEELLCWSLEGHEVRLVTRESGGVLCFRDGSGGLLAMVSPPTGVVFTSVFAAKDGRFYAASSLARIYAFDHNGGELWVRDAQLWNTVTPGTPYPDTQVTTDANGQVYAVTNRGDVTAFGPAGNELFSYSIGEKLYGETPPLVHTDGTLYVEARNGDTLCVSNQGNVGWRFPQG